MVQGHGRSASLRHCHTAERPASSLRCAVYLDVLRHQPQLVVRPRTQGLLHKITSVSRPATQGKSTWRPGDVKSEVMIRFDQPSSSSRFRPVGQGHSPAVVPDLCHGVVGCPAAPGRQHRSACFIEGNAAREGGRSTRRRQIGLDGSFRLHRGRRFSPDVDRRNDSCRATSPASSREGPRGASAMCNQDGDTPFLPAADAFPPRGRQHRERARQSRCTARLSERAARPPLECKSLDVAFSSCFRVERSRARAAQKDSPFYQDSFRLRPGRKLVLLGVCAE